MYYIYTINVCLYEFILIGTLVTSVYMYVKGLSIGILKGKIYSNFKGINLGETINPLNPQ